MFCGDTWGIRLIVLPTASCGVGVCNTSGGENAPDGYVIVTIGKFCGVNPVTTAVIETGDDRGAAIEMLCGVVTGAIPVGDCAEGFGAVGRDIICAFISRFFTSAILAIAGIVLGDAPSVVINSFNTASGFEMAVGVVSEKRVFVGDAV